MDRRKKYIVITSYVYAQNHKKAKMTNKSLFYDKESGWRAPPNTFSRAGFHRTHFGKNMTVSRSFINSPR